MAEAREFELVFTRAKGFERRPLPSAPEPAPGEVLVRPKHVGICGSDLFLMEGQEGELRLGHEWVGVVDRAGAGASAFRPGDSVTSTGTLSCGGCLHCSREETHFCDHAEYLSSDRLGALRSWML
ncbi:MAG TPA: alcohol dehydrogenase catalytic domain-containing protein, partial [Bdellovibrionota bacterium]|nr:alcohol dehydrogenase catalytic domain-containing protein [Bdellovibrionota bacterium]